MNTAIQDCFFSVSSNSHSPHHPSIMSRHYCPLGGGRKKINAGLLWESQQHIINWTWRITATCKTPNLKRTFVWCLSRLSFCSTDSGKLDTNQLYFITLIFHFFLLLYILPVTIDVVTVGIALLVLCVLKWVLIFQTDNEFRHQEDWPQTLWSKNKLKE